MTIDEFRNENCMICGSQRCPADEIAISSCGYYEGNISGIEKEKALSELIKEHSTAAIVISLNKLPLTKIRDYVKMLLVLYNQYAKDPITIHGSLCKLSPIQRNCDFVEASFFSDNIDVGSNVYENSKTKNENIYSELWSSKKVSIIEKFRIPVSALLPLSAPETFDTLSALSAIKEYALSVSRPEIRASIKEKFHSFNLDEYSSMSFKDQFSNSLVSFIKICNKQFLINNTFELPATFKDLVNKQAKTENVSVYCLAPNSQEVRSLELNLRELPDQIKLLSNDTQKFTKSLYDFIWFAKFMCNLANDCISVRQNMYLNNFVIIKNLVARTKETAEKIINYLNEDGHYATQEIVEQLEAITKKLIIKTV